MKGVVAAGHPLTAEAGASVLRDGGNAVDAAVAAVLTSFVTEPVLTGPGAGGFMLVHTAGGEDHLLDFFVAAPGLGEPVSPAELQPVDVHFSDTVVQEFHVGPASCGAYGNTAGLAEALGRFGSARLSDLTAGPARLAREGVEIGPLQEYLFEILSPLLNTSAEAAALYEPEGRPLMAGETLRQPELGDLLERLGAEGPAFMYTGDVAAAVAEWIGGRGGLLAPADLAAYRVEERTPARVTYRGREVLTNPPPSCGGILIAYALALLERLERPGDLLALVEAMDGANRARTPEFLAGLQSDTLLDEVLAADALDSAASGAASRLGSTTHVSVLDAEGALRQRHVLERLELGRRGARDRDPHEQHARRGRPQPARLAPARRRLPDPEHDGPDRGAPRGPAGGGDRLRRIEPDPVGHPADDHRGGR